MRVGDIFIFMVILNNFNLYIPPLTLFEEAGIIKPEVKLQYIV